MKKLVVLMLFVSVVTFCISKTYAGSFLDGFTFNGEITLVLQNLQNSNGTFDEDGVQLKDGNRTPTVGQYSADLKIKKEFDKNNIAFLHLETGKGNIGYYLHSVANVNRDADDSGKVRMTEAWFKHKFLDTFAISAGVLDATKGIDENAYANDETTQFIGAMFRNSANIMFADNNVGVRANACINYADFAIQYVQETNRVDDDLPTDFLRAGFASAQVNFKPGLIGNTKGNYRIYGWINTTDQLKLNGTSTGKEKDYGFGVSIDQQLSNIFGLFCRYSWSRSDIGINTAEAGETAAIAGTGAEHVWSAGLQANIKGIGDKDTIGLAYGQIVPSQDYRKANKLAGEKPEGHIEVYYSWNISNYLAISPDFQMVTNPYYSTVDNEAYVGTLRMQISF